MKWWREVFLPHIRSTYTSFDEKVLLLVENSDPIKSALLKDPTGQCRVEALPKGIPDITSLTSGAMRHYRPLDMGVHTESIVEATKRRYRYQLLNEVTEVYDERHQRRIVASRASIPPGSLGLREGHVANAYDAMRILKGVWDDVQPSSIKKGWQKTKLRSVDPTTRMANAATPAPARARNEERKQTAKDKKQMVKDITAFMKKEKPKDTTQDPSARGLEEMVDKLKDCFLYAEGNMIDSKDIVDALDIWVDLEDLDEMKAMCMQELKLEMNIEYLVGLEEPVEATTPDAEEAEDDVGSSPATNKGEGEELDIDTALELAATIKATASKVFLHGELLGDLAVRLDEAADSVFRLLRQQKQLSKKEAAKEAAKQATKKVRAKTGHRWFHPSVTDQATDGSAGHAMSQDDANTDQAVDGNVFVATHGKSQMAAIAANAQAINQDAKLLAANLATMQQSNLMATMTTNPASQQGGDLTPDEDAGASFIGI
jgi:hypothetical protein